MTSEIVSGLEKQIVLAQDRYVKALEAVANSTTDSQCHANMDVANCYRSTLNRLRDLLGSITQNNNGEYYV
jgi:hypothetical protein